jgi:hypothetical protein
VFEGIMLALLSWSLSLIVSCGGSGDSPDEVDAAGLADFQVAISGKKSGETKDAVLTLVLDQKAPIDFKIDSDSSKDKFNVTSPKLVAAFEITNNYSYLLTVKTNPSGYECSVTQKGKLDLSKKDSEQKIIIKDINFRCEEPTIKHNPKFRCSTFICAFSIARVTIFAVMTSPSSAPSLSMTEAILSLLNKRIRSSSKER